MSQSSLRHMSMLVLRTVRSMFVSRLSSQGRSVWMILTPSMVLQSTAAVATHANRMRTLTDPVRSSSNPIEADGSGLALAHQAGAELADLEFVQFHPTAMALGGDPMPLATEAIRGEGAILVNGCGLRFMADVPGAELAARDVVARAIWEQIAAGESVFLDAGEALGERFAMRFPTVTARCRAAGIDPARQPIPVRPAAHYHMGGIEVDTRGRATVPGLWACGEVAATGLHGANRLASNSLLEAVVCARRLAADLLGRPAKSGMRRPFFLSARPQRGAAMEVRRLMEETVGVVRDRPSLELAVRTLSRLAKAEQEAGRS